MEKEDKDVIGQFSIVIIALILVVPSVLIWAYCTHIIWGWFAFPLFGVWPSFWQLVGLQTLLSLFLTDIASKYDLVELKKKEFKFSDSLSKMIANGILKPLIILFYAWIVHHFLI